MTLAVIGILYGSALAAVQNEMKRLVAYSSLAQVGFIVLGIASGSAIATSGAVLLMFNHGVITAAFFLLIGGLERRRGTSLISGPDRPPATGARLGGTLHRRHARLDRPARSERLRVEEYLVLLGTFGVHPWWAVVATTGVIFAALYLLWAYQRVFHGDAQGANAEIPPTPAAPSAGFSPR
jgi:NADH-quinone oxidoreductase subunit M